MDAFQEVKLDTHSPCLLYIQTAGKSDLFLRLDLFRKVFFTSDESALSEPTSPTPVY